MRTNSLSDTLDRLEGKGFVERQPHPIDGRKVSVVGTASGASRIGSLFGGLISRLSELDSAHTTAELAIVGDYQRRAAEIQLAESRALVDDAESGRP